MLESEPPRPVGTPPARWSGGRGRIVLAVAILALDANQMVTVARMYTDDGPPSVPWAGIARLEMQARDRDAGCLPSFGSALHRDARGPVNLPARPGPWNGGPAAPGRRRAIEPGGSGGCGARASIFLTSEMPGSSCWSVVISDDEGVDQPLAEGVRANAEPDLLWSLYGIGAQPRARGGSAPFRVDARRVSLPLVITADAYSTSGRTRRQPPRKQSPGRGGGQPRSGGCQASAPMGILLTKPDVISTEPAVPDSSVLRSHFVSVYPRIEEKPVQNIPEH